MTAKDYSLTSIAADFLLFLICGLCCVLLACLWAIARCVDRLADGIFTFAYWIALSRVNKWPYSVFLEAIRNAKP